MGTRAQLEVRRDLDGSLGLWRRLLGSANWDLVVVVGAGRGDALLEVELPRGAEIVVFEGDGGRVDELQHLLQAGACSVDLRPQVVTSAAHHGRPRSSHTTTLDLAVGLLGPRRACIKVAGRAPSDVLAGGRHALARMTDLVVHVDIDQVPIDELVSWTQDWRVYAHDRRTLALIRLDGGRPDQTADLLARPWISSGVAVLRRAG